MRLIGLAIATLALTLGLSACSTSDALTPQVDVGTNGTRSSAPLTDADLQSAANAASPPGGNTQPGYAANPQNTLEAQAQALTAGSNSVASAPLAAPGQSSGGNLQPPPAASSAAAPPAAPSQQTAAPQQTAAAPTTAAAGTVRFLPIIGAPVQAVTPLSRQLGAEARAKGLTIKGANDPASEHILKGYFSAFASEGNVNVVYVWDILDANGGRLHRIQGQETIRSNATDPWAAVPASTMQQIATKTIAQYMAWRPGGRG
ncbi:hypothetical protein HFC70_18720 [Agrobacterium sp. a22-2]|uniref:hypothetical protein n=1 Tax=Agrobacterium sp. a22-2 TaxID=2283840 RepID=UPI0014464168|nr:hypothetical protein [Agrobacterium sp. a22-2]NKN38388.1 hypothetical protein [Agrobacterium sp. a22-2]